MKSFCVAEDFSCYIVNRDTRFIDPVTWTVFIKASQQQLFEKLQAASGCTLYKPILVAYRVPRIRLGVLKFAGMLHPMHQFMVSELSADLLSPGHQQRDVLFTKGGLPQIMGSRLSQAHSVSCICNL